MIAFLSAGQSFAQEEIRVVSSSVLTVPVALTQETEIRSIDIQVTYNPELFEVTGIDFTGGIFENQNDYVQEHKIVSAEGRCSIVIYSTGNLIRTKGDAVFLKLSVRGTEGAHSSLTLSKFDVNDQPAAGGFSINDKIFQSISFLVNHRPVAESGSLTTDEDTNASGILTVDDNDSDTLNFHIVSDPAKGKVEITDAATGGYVYKPGLNENGTDSFTYLVNDDFSDSDIASITVTIRSVNDAPLFTSTPSTAAEQNSLYTYSITTSDVDADDTLKITAPQLPSWLTLTHNGNGSAILSGTPSDADVGNNEVILEVKDGAGSTDTQSFVILVKDVNDPPLITGHKHLSMLENTGMTLTLDHLSVQDPDNRFPQDFTLTVDDGENYSRYGNTISPFPDFEGILTVPVKVNDGEADSNIFSVNITVTRVNKPPAAEAQTLTCSEDAEIAVTLTGADSDDDSLSYFISALPKNGSLYLMSGGVRGEKISQIPTLLDSEYPRVIYAPPTDGNGDAYGDFGFRVNDRTEDSVEALITVNVTPVNDSPVLNEGRYASLSDMNENDVAASGDTVSAFVSGLITDPDTGSPENAVTVVSADNSGGMWQYALSGADWQNFGDALGENQALLLGGESKVRFVPNQDWSGTAGFVFRAWDRTFGNEGEIVNISETGGTAAFSSGTNTAMLVVHALSVSGLRAENDSPTLIGTETHFTAFAEIGSHITYTWDFGDASNAEGASVAHVYSDLGVYTATVAAQNSVSTVRTSTFVTVCSDALTVSNDGDSGKGSLRYAIENICEKGSITFSSELPRSTVIVVNSPLNLNKDMSIRNQDVPNLTVSGDKKKRIFEIEPNVAVEMEGLTIAEGYAEDGLGGGIYNQGILTLNNCTLFGNSADAGSAAIDSEGRVILYAGAARDNIEDSFTVTGIGAGAVLNTGIITLTQCTLSGNISRAGDRIGEGTLAGGIFNSGEMRMRHCTLAANMAEKKSAELIGVGGLCNFLGNVSIEHSLIAENTGDNGADAYGIFISGGWNLVGDGTGSQGWEEEKGDIIGAKENPVDPMLGELADKGGLTQTQALLTGSPATDAGNPNFNIPPVFDQRGKEDFPRVHDGNGDGKAVIDIGAYEFSFGFITTPLRYVNKGEAYHYAVMTTGLGLLTNHAVTAAKPLPEWLTLKDNRDGTASLSGMPASEDVGEHPVELQLENLVTGMRDFQVFTVTVVDVNIAPHITGQRDLETKQETSLTVTLNDLTVNDPDNIFPNDFMLTLGDGDNCTREGNTVTPNAGFIGLLRIPATVNDGKDESDVFFLTVSVTAVEKNTPPQIAAQRDLETKQETSLTITLNDLTVNDPDNIFPNDFTLTLGDGDNYIREGNTVTPNAGFVGLLKIPATVNDGKDESNVFFLTVYVTAVEKNTPPQIAAQRDLQTKQETSLTITLNDLTVNDPDNIFPNDFTLTLGDGDNCTRESNTVTPNAGFIGLLRIPATVNDGKDNSNVFFLTVSVTAVEKNTPPQIAGQRDLETKQETSLTITLNDLTVSDPDNIFPDDFTLTLGDGDNYTREGGTVTPNAGFTGLLKIPATVSDGKDESNVFFLTVSVSQAENVQIISGALRFPENALPGETARITAFSAFRNSGSDVQIAYEGAPEVPYAINGLLHADDYIVSAESDSYKKRYYDGSERGSESRKDAKALQTGSSEAEAVRFVLEPGLSVSGRIIDADSGTGLAGIAVEAWSDISDSGKVVLSSADGSYIIRGLKSAADFKIAAWKTNAAPFFYNSEKTVREQKDASPVSLENGSQENIVIEVREEKDIHGAIRDQAGNPVPRVWVYAKSESRNTEHGVFSDSDGTYRIVGLPVADDYKVSVQPENGSSYLPEEKENVSMDSDTDFTLRYRETYKIAGTVRDGYGNDISDVDVEIVSNSGKFYAWSLNGEGIQGYEITGIPPGDDYVIRARPPEASDYAVFTSGSIAIREDMNRDIILEPGLKISGRVSDEQNAPVQGLSVIAVSREKNFEGKALSDKDGFYEITHAPDASDYSVTAFSEDYITQEKPISSPGWGVDFILETGGFLRGEVTDRYSLKAVAEAWVEVYSEQFGVVSDVSASAKTDKNGRYEIKGLRQYDEGREIEDYIITVYSDAYAPQSVSGKKSGDTADFLLTGRNIYLLDPSGMVMEIKSALSGTVADAEGNLLSGVILDIFITDGNFVQSVISGSNGTFSVENLSSDATYQLRFTNEETMQVQWAGEGDIGFDEPDPEADTNPENAKSYDALGVMINFRFSASPARSGGTQSGNMRSAREGSRVRDLRVLPSESLFRTPNITAVWDISGENSEEKYYYVFNQNSDHELTKRNVPRIRPMAARRAVSSDIIADDIPYYCHVAPVDGRGRIGETEQVFFRIDTVAPSCPNVTMPKKTSDQYVSVGLGATGASEMYLSNTAYGEDGKWERWKKSAEWKLTQGEGEKKIYVLFRDRAGNTARALGTTEKTDSLPDEYRIIAGCGLNGRISPSGYVSVNQGDNQTFALLPDEGYETDKLFINGKSEPVSGDSYTFRNVYEDASIAVTFRAKVIITYSITAVCGPGGTVTPSGEVIVVKGEDISFSITPDEGYDIDSVLLDGKKVRQSDDGMFNFINVSQNHALYMTFKSKG